MESSEKTLELIICSNAANICCTSRRVIDFLMDKFKACNPDSFFEVKVILNELITNAINHGNQNIESKCVKLNVNLIQSDTIQIRVQDEGCGFDYSSLIKTDNSLECWETESMKECGRGLRIVKNLSENVSFNVKGNEITVTYKLC